MQGQFEHAVVVFYKALVLGVRSQRPDLIAMCTALVGAAGQRYREMLAETNGRLAKDRYSRELARVWPSSPVVMCTIETVLEWSGMRSSQVAGSWQHTATI